MPVVWNYLTLICNEFAPYQSQGSQDLKVSGKRGIIKLDCFGIGGYLFYMRSVKLFFRSCWEMDIAQLQYSDDWQLYEAKNGEKFGDFVKTRHQFRSEEKIRPRWEVQQRLPSWKRYFFSLFHCLLLIASPWIFFSSPSPNFFQDILPSIFHFNTFFMSISFLFIMVNLFVDPYGLWVYTAPWTVRFDLKGDIMRIAWKICS